jgi:hypothetical protein
MKIVTYGKGNENEFLKMLAWIEVLGSVGHSASFNVFCDGDGSTRLKFDLVDDVAKEKFKILKKNLINEHINTYKDVKSFGL